MNRFFTTQQTMNILGVSRSKLYTLAKQGKLRPREGLGRGNIYYSSDIESYMENLEIKEIYLTADEIRYRKR